MNMRFSHTGSRSAAKTVALLALGILALVFALVLAGCGSTTSTTVAGETTTTAGGTSGTQIAIRDLAFEPATLTVNAGDAVTWTNEDTVAHDVVADDGSFDSGTLDAGKSFSFTFTQSGTVSYHCSIHPSMTGTIVVQ